MFRLPYPLRPRSLRHCVIATVVIGFLLLTATQYLVTGRFVESQLLDIESRDGFTRLSNLHHALDQLADDLESTTSDWSEWDATWEFATGSRPQYVSDNLTPQSMQRLRLDFLILIDEHGRAAFARSLSEDRRELLAPPLDLVAMAEGTGLLSGASDPMHKLTGLVSGASGTYLVSSQPVLLSTPGKPPGGRLVMGRSIDRYVAPALRRVTGETLDILPLHTQPTTAAHLIRGENGQSLALQDTELTGFSELRDLWGAPIATIRLTMTRPTQTLLEQARQHLLISTLVVGIIFCGIAMLLARLSLIRPIERLSSMVEQIGRSGQQARVTMRPSSREFQTLAAAINGMLHQVEQQQIMRRDRDAAVEANRLKSEFLATMSHEIRTPMNGVLGMCELLQRTELSPRQRHLSDTILRSARSLLGMLNDVLDFSKIESGKLDLECAAFSPAEIVQSVGAPFLAAAQTKGLEFSVRIEAGVPALLMGDELRLRQILNNLLSNAVKFTEHGSVAIVCAATTLDRDRVELRFTIEDTGIGISPEAQQHIFDPFAQAATNTSRVYGGTGLGLAIVRRLVALMGGEIQLLSEPGRGSQFTFTTIMKRAMDLSSMRSSLAEATGPHFSTQKSPAILLAEDNAVNREVFKEMLEYFGCKVTAVENGALAVAAVAERAFDAILMDCQMPVMDGHTATSEVRTLERATAQQPAFIIALTADATPENHRRCIDSGMDAVATKPITHARLRELIMRVVQPGAARA